MAAGNVPIGSTSLLDGNAVLTSANDDLSEANTVLAEVGDSVTEDADMVAGGNGWEDKKWVRSGTPLLAGALFMLFVVGVSAVGFDKAIWSKCLLGGCTGGFPGGLLAGLLVFGASRVFVEGCESLGACGVRGRCEWAT